MTTNGLDAAPLSHAIFRVARAHKALAGSLLRGVGLYPGQELVLMTLWAQGPQRLVDLVEATDSDAPSMTRSITRLEKAGLVRRERSQTDRRVVIVEATEASLELRPGVTQAWAELERLTTGSLSPQQQRDIIAHLSTLEATLAAVERP